MGAKTRDELLRWLRERVIDYRLEHLLEEVLSGRRGDELASRLGGEKALKALEVRFFARMGVSVYQAALEIHEETTRHARPGPRIQETP